VDILIVDNSAAIRKILQPVLQQANIKLGKIYEAGDGKEELAALRSQPVDLILSDMNLPNIDSLEFLRQVRADTAFSQIPFVMITTEGAEAKVMDAVKLGASGYIRKPFTPDVIEEKLRSLI
jgi:two-component system, chemotaxis family, chemotaxis protein CheY